MRMDKRVHIRGLGVDGVHTVEPTVYSSRIPSDVKVVLRFDSASGNQKVQMEPEEALLLGERLIRFGKIAQGKS